MARSGVGKPHAMLLPEGQMSGHVGANYLYKIRHKIENIFGRSKDWRRISTSYDRCSHSYFSATCIAASCNFYISS